MKVIELESIQRAFDPAEAIDVMRQALVTQARGECDTPMPFDSEGITVCDFTGLGVEDLFIASYAYEKQQGQHQSESKDTGA